MVAHDKQDTLQILEFSQGDTWHCFDKEEGEDQPFADWKPDVACQYLNLKTVLLGSVTFTGGCSIEFVITKNEANLKSSTV